MKDVLQIETKRLVLRPLVQSDAPRFARFINDPVIAANTARIPHPYPPIAAEGWLLIRAVRKPLERDFVFAAHVPGEGLIGLLGAHGMGLPSEKNGAVEIGYWFGRPYWGQGYASEAVRAFVAEAQSLGPLEAGHFVDNPASGRVLQRAGFSYTGETQEMFSLGRGKRVHSLRMRHEASHRRVPAAA